MNGSSGYLGALYPGAGYDVIPLVMYPEIKTWYYVDCRPKTPSQFVNHVKKAMSQVGFSMIEHIHKMYLFFHPETSQTVYYYTNCLFPYEVTDIQADILIYCGFSIEQFVLPSYFDGWKRIIINNRSDYPALTSPVEELRYKDNWRPEVIEEMTVEKIKENVTIHRKNE